jgi:signal transduction histidine kinase
MVLKDMIFEYIIDISIGLVTIGLTIFLVFFYLKKRSSFTSGLILELYKLNKDVNQDVLIFIDQAWSILENSGFQKMFGKVSWYGEPKDISFGKKPGFLLKMYLLKSKRYLIEIDEGDISVKLTLIVKQNIQAENKLIAEIIYQTFSMLLFSNVNSKNMQFVLSKERLERFQLFIYHDVKNLAQFISLLTTQVKNLQTDQEKIVLVDRLGKLLPSLSEKVQKITSHMHYGKENFSDVERFDLIEQLKYYADINELSLDIKADEKSVYIYISSMVLKQVFTELMHNFKAHCLVSNSLIRVDILKKKEIMGLEFTTKKDKKEAVVAERMFEPFWTTSKSGMGLGLFIIREILKKSGGKIEFKQSNNDIVFEVYLPINSIH